MSLRSDHFGKRTFVVRPGVDRASPDTLLVSFIQDLACINGLDKLLHGNLLGVNPSPRIEPVPLQPSSFYVQHAQKSLG